MTARTLLLAPRHDRAAFQLTGRAACAFCRRARRRALLERSAFRARRHTHLCSRFADGARSCSFATCESSEMRLSQPAAADARLDKLGIDALERRRARASSTARAPAQDRRSRRCCSIKACSRASATSTPTRLCSWLVCARRGARIASISRDAARSSHALRAFSGARFERRHEHRRLRAARRQRRRLPARASRLRAQRGALPALRQPIRRVVLGQRSAHFCPACQR